MSTWQPKVKAIHWHSDSTFSNFFSSKKHLGRLKPNFLWSLSGMLGWKFVQMFRATWPRWLPSPYMVKTFKNVLLRNQEADDIETWYEASSTQVLPNWFKWWHWVDLVHFYDMVNLFPNASACSHIFPSLFLFSISYALRWAIQDQWSSGFY